MNHLFFLELDPSVRLVSELLLLSRSNNRQSTSDIQFVQVVLGEYR
jgi:hypothetical protein